MMNPSYNNPFGGVQQPIMSSGGDVVIPASNTPTKKRWPIVVMAVLAIVVIIIAIVFAVIPNFGGGSNLATTQKYLNYVVNGDEKDSDVGNDYSDQRVYYLNDVMNSDDAEIFSAFYNKASTMLDEISKKVTTDDKKLSITTQKDLLAMIKFWYDLKSYDNNAAIAELYMTSGREAIDEIIAKVDGIVFDGNSYIQEYVYNMDTRLDTVVELIDYYRAIGCSGETVVELTNCELATGEERLVDITTMEHDLAIASKNIRFAVEGAKDQFIAEAYFLVNGETQGGSSDGK